MNYIDTLRTKRLVKHLHGISLKAVFALILGIILFSFVGDITASAQTPPTLPTCQNALDNQACTVPLSGNGCATYGREQNTTDTPSQTKTCYARNERPNNSVPTPAPSNQTSGTTGGTTLPVGYDFINIIGIKCLFQKQGGGCTAENSLIDVLIKFLYDLAIPLAILVIIYGGYQYFFGGFTGKADGMKTIQAAVTGLILVLSARFITTTVNSTFTSTEPFKIDAIKDFVLQITLLLSNLAAVIAVLVIIWGGFQFFFSALPGNKASGRETITKGVIGLAVILLARPIITLVQSTLGQSNDTLKLDPTSIIYVIQTIVTNFLIPISAVLTVFFIIIGAYQLLTAGGDSGRAKAGRESLRNAVIGLIVVLLATTFTQIVIYVFRNTNLAPSNGGTQTTIQSNQSTNTNTTTSPTNNTGNSTGGTRPVPNN